MTARAVPGDLVEQELTHAFLDQVARCREIFAEPGFDLPMLPSSAMRVLNLIQDAGVSPRKVAQTIQLDPVLTAKFLRLANSPFYAGTRKVESVQVAIDRLGMATVKNVVLTISLNSTIVREKRLGPGAMKLWDHALHCAIAAQALATRLRLPGPQVFLMGLMHDIGKLPAWIMLNSLRARGDIREEFLETLVEDSHARLGGVLVGVWQMPQEVGLAASGHHSVTSLDEANAWAIQNTVDLSVSVCHEAALLLCCTALADRALAALGLSNESNDLVLGDGGLARDLGLTEKEMVDYLAELPKIIKENAYND